MLIGHDARGGGLEDDAGPLLDRLVGLFLGRHVLEVAAVDDRHLGGSLAHRRPRAVDGGEATADDHDPRALQSRHGEAAGRVVEVLQGVDHAVRILSGDAQLVALVAADGHVDRVVLGQDVGEMEVAPQAHVGLERRPQLPDVVELAVHPAFRQPILRDPVAQHAALLRLCLEDVAVVAAQLEVIGGSQAAWSCADDRHAASRLRVLRPGDRGRRVDFQHPIGAIAVAVANGDGGVDLLAAAVRLARRRADPAEDGGERQ